MGGKSWAKFGSDYVNLPVEIDVEQGLVTKVRILNPDGSLLEARQFSRVYERNTDGQLKLIDVFWGQYSSKKFSRLASAVIKDSYLDKNGGLFIGRRSWAKFGSDYVNLPVEIDVEQGLVTKVPILNPDCNLLEAKQFSRVYERNTDGQLKLIDVFWGRYSSKKFSRLASAVIKDFYLDKNGALEMG